MSTALGIVPRDDGKGNLVGVTPLAHRKIIQGLWDNPGKVAGLSVNGRSDLRYDVLSGMAVLSRVAGKTGQFGSWTDGFTEAYWAGGQTPAVKAGDPSNPRIDTIWLRANDHTQGDADNQVTVGVAQGTPSASPVAPAAPAGALAIGYKRVPAGATSTASAQSVGDIDWAVPYGATRGILYHGEEGRDGSVEQEPGTLYGRPYREPFLRTDIYLPTDRWVFLRAYLCVSTPNKDGKTGIATVQFLVDKNIYTTRKVSYDGSWTTYEPTTTIRLAAGRHGVGISMWREVGEPFVCHVAAEQDAKNNKYVGRILVVTDMGVAV